MNHRTILIVESPSKCKTIKNILGNNKNIEVIASKGHIKQVIPKKDSIEITDTLDIKWENHSSKTQYLVKQIKAFKPEEIILATDLDREGEAISWHIKNLLLENKINNIPMRRMIFNEITKPAIDHALNNLKDIDNNLVNSYITRLVLDFKIGFEITPILWKFLRVFQNQSAGRVQSPTLGLIIEKEKEIVNFKKTKYFIHQLQLCKESNNNEKYIGLINSYKGKKLPIYTEKTKLEDLLNQLNKKLQVKSIKKKDLVVKPKEPFTTSSLQQAASNNLNFNVSKTMQLAQKLYEGIEINGKSMAFITYMRTDNCTISDVGIKEIRKYLTKEFEPKYISKTKNVFKNKKKNTQESHEAIRPVNINNNPNILKNIDKDLYELYNLIWQRSLSSQMSNAIFENITANIQDNDCEIQVKHSYLKFQGFKKIYGDESEDMLFNLQEGDNLLLTDKIITECETKPPARYSEAKLVSEMEKQGIGRPSTYGYILDILKKRNYIYMKNKALFPTDKGVITFYFLYYFFHNYIDCKFTANMEEKLDKICENTINHVKFLQEFNGALSEICTNVAKETNVIKKFSQDVVNIFKTKCSKCESMELDLQIKFSFFFRCLKCNHVESINIQKYTYDDVELLISSSFKMLKNGEKKVYLPNVYNFQKEDLDFLKKLPIENSDYIARSTSYSFAVENKKDQKKKYFKDLNSFIDYIKSLKLPL